MSRFSKNLLHVFIISGSSMNRKRLRPDFDVEAFAAFDRYSVFVFVCEEESLLFSLY